MINDLEMERDALQNEMKETVERNLEENRILSGALQELVIRNLNFEKQLTEIHEKENQRKNEEENQQKKTKLNLLNPHITPINFKARR